MRGLVSLDGPRRYQARHRLLGAVAKRVFRTRVYDAYNVWFEEPEYRAIWAGSPWQVDDLDARPFSLFNLIKLVRDLPGDTAECGCYLGRASHVMLEATKAQARAHHVFDSFEGLSDPSPEDALGSGQRGDVYEWKPHDLTAREADVRRNLERFAGRVHFYKGWIPERFGDVADRTFSFVHVDVDLYRPTLDSFAFFYPRLVPGGILLCDDYGFSSCPGANRAVKEYAASVDAPVVHLPTGQAMVMKR